MFKKNSHVRKAISTIILAMVLLFGMPLAGSAVGKGAKVAEQVKAEARVKEQVKAETRVKEQARVKKKK